MYYFRAVSETGRGDEMLSEEMRMTAKFGTEVITEYIERIEYIDNIQQVILECPIPTVCPNYIQDVIYKDEILKEDTGEIIKENFGKILSKISILEINNQVADTFLYDKFGIKFIDIIKNKQIIFYGRGVPNTKFTLIIY